MTFTISLRRFRFVASNASIYYIGTSLADLKDLVQFHHPNAIFVGVFTE
jgi:hypothetical protein